MPRITISIVAPGHDLDQEFLSYELPGDLSIGDLKGFISAETDLPASSQQFYLNSVPINGDKQSLDEAGIKDGDMLAMLMRSAEQPNNMGGQRLQQPQGQQRRASNADADEIETARLSIMGNPRAMAQVREQRPALAQAVSDPIRFREVWMEMTPVIDLRSNKLVFGDGNEVSFLGEADIPKQMEEALQSEPTVQGPNGTAIGGRSGTVRPANGFQ
ncbi:hypothetical protein M433DRAFT_387445 [Acidomyces richmondensis BFW]|nr:MAG: hypothetical protein FE78DRAFT_233804 [Acidomyces sp. 'richmondensis']KYG42850.1 hypothetical protein M433DRAFT_387445 [Acidomyces richmondensis BFW]